LCGANRPSGAGRLGQALFHLVGDASGRPAQVAEPSADAAADLGETLRADEDKGHGGDEQKLLGAEVEHENLPTLNLILPFLNTEQ